MNDLRKKNKVINNFLSDLGSNLNHFIQLGDLDKALNERQRAVAAKMTTIEEFVNSVEQECIVKSDKFNFFLVPEHVARRNYSRKDYEGIILKVLLKVKELAV